MTLVVMDYTNFTNILIELYLVGEQPEFNDALAIVNRLIRVILLNIVSRYYTRR